MLNLMCTDICMYVQTVVMTVYLCSVCIYFADLFQFPIPVFICLEGIVCFIQKLLERLKKQKYERKRTFVCESSSIF